MCDNRIVIVKGDDTDWNGQTFVTLRLNTDILDLSEFQAKITLGGIVKTFQDISSGEIELNYSKNESATLPVGKIDGVLELYKQDKKATIESRLPFLVVHSVHGNAIATEPFEMTINVEQGGENILEINVESAVSVEVNSTTTLPAGSEAYVHNSGTLNHLKLDFGIPRGEKGEQGEHGEQGPVGPDGKDAKINGVNTLTLTATDGLALTQSGNVATLSGKAIQDSVTSEATNRQNADNNLQNQIDAITASSDVTDIVGTYAELQAYDTSSLPPNSIIKVLQDENRNDETTYYRWVITGGVGSWVLIGEEGPYYTKSEADGKFVPQTRTVNGKALSGNITLDASDVGAATSAQGAKADTAIQPNDLGTAAYEDAGSFATAAQGTKADTAVQPADIANMVTTNTAQDITATKTFKAQQRIQSGQADGCLIVGADSGATTLTNGVRKLCRLGFPTNEDITLNCAFVSCDTQAATSGQVIQNCAEFGGRAGDKTSTSPDVINFTVATEHNTLDSAKKKLALAIDKNSANFTSEPQYNGSPLVTTDTQQTITAKKRFSSSTWNGGLTLKRTTTGSSFVVFENSDNVLGGVGLSPSSVPISTDRTNQNAWAIVRGGAWNNPAVGDSTTPVYIDSNGMAQPCSQSIGPSVVTLANNSTVTIASNTMYKAGTLTSFGITVPTGSYPFVCEFDFKSGSTATTITYTGTIKWVDGSDDIINDVFVPVTNKSYTVVIWWNNNAWVGSAKGV